MKCQAFMHDLATEFPGQSYFALNGDKLLDMESRLLNTFGKRLKVLRSDLHLTQLDLIKSLERRCNVSVGQSYISELERTSKIPNGEIIIGLAKL